MTKALVTPGKSPGASVLWTTGWCGTSTAVSTGRRVSSTCRSVTTRWTSPCGWWFPPGQGRKPWYLLTNEPIADAADAWKVVFAYARRWQVELCYRACKTDLAMESPRLWFWENRLTLLLMVSLRCSFLLSLLHPHCQPLVEGLLRNWCHRTGKRYRDTASHNQISSKCLVACLPSPFFTIYPKFGMTHVCIRYYVMLDPMDWYGIQPKQKERSTAGLLEKGICRLEWLSPNRTASRKEPNRINGNRRGRMHGCRIFQCVYPY